MFLENASQKGWIEVICGSMFSGKTEELIRRAAESDAVKAQQADPDTDIFTGLPFKSSSSDMTDEQKQAAFKTYVDGCDEAKKAALYIKMRSLPGDEELNAQVQQIMGSMTRADMERMLSEGLTGQTGMNAQTIAGYLAAMSDEDMTALFRKQVGISPKEYLTNYRMEIAAKLLVQRNLTVKEVAAACGYVDIYSFTKAFKKHYGCAPGQYAHNHK